MMDYYELLGVTRSASDAEIKRAYRQLSFQYHPDKNSSADAEALYKEINSAYDTLSNAEKRRVYNLRYSFGLVEEEAASTHHRDPRYTQRSRMDVREPKRDIMLEISKKIMRYFVWFNYAVILFISLFIIDYFLPYVESTETVTGVQTYNLTARRSYYYITTSGGKEMHIKFAAIPDVVAGDKIDLWYSEIYGSLMKLKVPSSAVTKIASRYGLMAVFAYVAFVLAILGVLFKDRNPAFALNTSSVGAFAILMLFFVGHRF